MAGQAKLGIIAIVIEPGVTETEGVVIAEDPVISGIIARIASGYVGTCLTGVVTKLAGPARPIIEIPIVASTCWRGVSERPACHTVCAVYRTGHTFVVACQTDRSTVVVIACDALAV